MLRYLKQEVTKGREFVNVVGDYDDLEKFHANLVRQAELQGGTCVIQAFNGLQYVTVDATAFEDFRPIERTYRKGLYLKRDFYVIPESVSREARLVGQDNALANRGAAITSERYAYIGRCKCGQIVAATVDEESTKLEVARDVADWIRNGLTVERVPVDFVRENFGTCQCEQQKRLFS